METIIKKKVIQALPTQILEMNGKFYYRYETRNGEVFETKKRFNSESQALNAAEKAIDYHWYVGH